MKLDVKAMALTGGLIWGGAVGMVAAVNLVRPRYGRRFLHLVSSVYPGYHARRSLKEAGVGSAYAFMDGAIGCAVFGAVYNRLAGKVMNQRNLRTAA